MTLFALHSTQPASEQTPVDGATGQVCIENISPIERRRRLIGGIVTFMLALGILGVLVATGVDRWWRLGLFPVFWGATVGYFQARDKT